MEKINMKQCGFDFQKSTKKFNKSPIASFSGKNVFCGNCGCAKKNVFTFAAKKFLISKDDAKIL